MTIRLSQALVTDEEFLALKPVFDRAYYGHAEKVVEFEAAVARYLGVFADAVICVSNGTAALHLALEAAGIGEGDEVIVPSLTFVASHQAIAAAGAKPVSCEVLDENLLIDPADVRRRITPKTKAIMPVHYTGNVCDMAAIRAIAAEHRLAIIEDAAHAFGSRVGGVRVGAAGQFVCFSFDSIKNVTCGEGGAVVCHDPAAASVIRHKRFLGMSRTSGTRDMGSRGDWFYAVDMQGYRYHMSNLNAAIGLSQITKADQFVARRQQIGRRYVEAFRKINGLRLIKTDYATTAPHIFVVRVEGGRRNALMDYLRDRKVQSGINYIPNHLHSFFRTEYALPVTEAAYEEILTIPLHCALTDDDVEYVITTVREFFEGEA